MTEFDYYTIEAKGGDVMPFCVYGWGTYEEGSVLEGQTRKSFLDAFETEAQARKAYPKAIGGTEGRSAHNSVAHLPGPDDPVPGGMYPDDY